MPETVLVVEDNDAMRTFVHEVLTEEMGLACDLAPDGQAGLDALARRGYDCILSDIRLPKADGFALLEAAQEHQPDTPTVLMTAFSTIEAALRAMRLGAYDFICKPIRTVQELEVVVQRALQHRRLLVECKQHLEEIERMNEALRHLNENLEEEVGRRTEELREANLRLRTLDEMKNNFLASISHELRTPLVSVRGYTELLSRGDLFPVPEEAQKPLAASLRNIDKLLELIKSLVRYAETAKEGKAFHFEKINLDALLREAVAALDERAAEKGVILRLDLADGEWPVLVDEDAFGEVLHHLLDNAIKFSEAGDEVEVRLDSLDDRLLQVSVADPGPGIPPEEQNRVFERFYQIDGGPTRRHGGTGMGLAIVRDNLRLHGCEIRLASAPGEGTRFSFTIPVAHLLEHAPVGASGTDPRPSPRNPTTA